MCIILMIQVLSSRMLNKAYTTCKIYKKLTNVNISLRLIFFTSCIIAAINLNLHEVSIFRYRLLRYLIINLACWPMSKEIESLVMSEFLYRPILHYKSLQIKEINCGKKTKTNTVLTESNSEKEVKVMFLRDVFICWPICYQLEGCVE